MSTKYKKNVIFVSVTEAKLFKSVYDNYSLYKGVVASIIGNGNPFVEDIINECCVSVVIGLHNGKIDINNISIDEKINTVYFKSLVYRRAIDWKRLKKNSTLCLEEQQEPQEEAQSTIIDYNVDELYYIREQLDKYESLTASNKFHVTIYKYWLLHEIPIAKLSKATSISIDRVRRSKNIMELKVNQWLKERQHQKQLQY